MGVARGVGPEATTAYSTADRLAPFESKQSAWFPLALGLAASDGAITVTDGATLSKRLLAALWKRIGVKPATVTAYDDATDEQDNTASGS